MNAKPEKIKTNRETCQDMHEKMKTDWKKMKTEQDSSDVEGKEYNWGGFSLLHFNKSGKTTTEIFQEDGKLINGQTFGRN